MTEAYDGRRVVGIDLHRRRSVIVRMSSSRVISGKPRSWASSSFENTRVAIQAP
jgi:hypothetical protein